MKLGAVAVAGMIVEAGATPEVLGLVPSKLFVQETSVPSIVASMTSPTCLALT